MSTHIFDIDGTLMRYHTNDFLEGALDMIQDLRRRGDLVMCITMRGPHDRGKEWSVENTLEAFKKQGLESINIIFNVPPNRALYDDTKPYAVHHGHNDSWGKRYE